MRSRLVIAESVRTAAGLSGNAVLVRDGRVDAIGRAEELRSAHLPECRYPGSVITPGLVDAHFHPLGYTAALMRLNLDKARNMEDLRELVGQASADLAPATALVGTRFDDQSIGRMPTRLDLDEAAGSRPVVIYRYCGHVAVASTAALELASITSNTRDPVGGSIDRDDRGNPTGVLRETAIALVAGPVGSRTGDLTPSELLAAMQGLASLGLTSLGAIIDLSGDLWCGVGNELDLLTEIAADLPLRMAVLAITDVPAKLHEAADRLNTAGPMVRFLGVKQFADGSFGGHTAAMHEPYSDQATTGTMRIDPGTGGMARTALQMGGRVAIHAIGDRANAAVLDLFETLITEGADPGNLRVEHVSVISKPDVERMADLGVTAVVQPAFLMSEADWLEDRIGQDRMDQTYAFRSLLEAGVPLAGSSDCPVEPPSPWWGMAAARDRAGLTPAQQLSAADAFAMFTAGSAKAIGSPTLEVGAPCDLAIVDRDPVEVDPDSVRHTGVLATWIEGEAVTLPADPIVWDANSPAG